MKATPPAGAKTFSFALAQMPESEAAATNSCPAHVTLSGMAVAQIKMKWLDLKARVHALKDDRFRAEVANHQKAEIGIPMLSLPASNAAMRLLGYSDGFAPLGPLQRLASKFAL